MSELSFGARLLSLLAFIPLVAVTPGMAAEDEDGSRGEDPKIHGIFETELPRTQWRSTLRLIFHPHFGDLTQRDYLRTPIGLRYGLTERWDVTSELESYVAHGLGDVSFGRKAGISGARFTTKYRLAEWMEPRIATATGISLSSPLGSPPPQVTDGLRHITPFVTFAHSLEARPEFTTFVSFAYDAATRTQVKGERRKNTFVDDSWSVTPGFVWQRGAFLYTGELAIATSAGVSRNPQTVFVVRPGVAWELPKALTFHSPGRWVFGLGLRAGFGPDGTDLGVSGKFRGDFDFRRLFGHRRERLP
jgi:hypothetical protein